MGRVLEELSEVLWDDAVPARLPARVETELSEVVVYLPGSASPACIGFKLGTGGVKSLFLSVELGIVRILYEDGKEQVVKPLSYKACFMPLGTPGSGEL
jgi:hypothetical protein